MTREQYEQTAGPDGALFIGSPQTVATKIVKAASEAARNLRDVNRIGFTSNVRIGFGRRRAVADGG